MKSVRLPWVIVIGGGELGSAVSHRLVRSGMCVAVVDIKRPTCIRRNVCFAMACIEGAKEVEGVRAEHVATIREANSAVIRGVLPVLTGDFRKIAARLEPDVFVDARMLKRDQDISVELAPLVIGLGPGFVAGGNVHVVIETKRGHNLGRLIYEGSAEPSTGVPAEIGGFSKERVIRASESGIFESRAKLGAIVRKEQVVGVIAGGVDVLAPIAGLLRGLISDGAEVRRGQKIGDVDPRGSSVDPTTISDKGRAVAGGVLEAVMHWWTS
jgi:xanthine dehydrogenase accessory factor